MICVGGERVEMLIGDREVKRYIETV